MGASTQIRPGFVETSHGFLECLEAGTGEPLILLPANPRSCRAFSRALPIVAAHDIRAIALSLPGYGDSYAPNESYTELRQFAQAIVWAMDGLGISRASIFGTHTGSQVALATAAEFPERVDKLILEEVFNWNTPARQAAHDRETRPDGSNFMRAWQALPVAESLASNTDTDLQFARDAFLDMLKKSTYGPGSATWAMGRYDSWEAAGKVRAPTLVIHGSESEMGRAHPKFLASIPRSTGLRPPTKAAADGSGGHSSWAQTSPEGFAKVIAGFLGKVSEVA